MKTKISDLTDEVEDNDNNANQLTKKLKEYEAIIKQARKNANDQCEQVSKLTKDNQNWSQKYKELEQELVEANEDHYMALENEQVQVEGLSGDLKENKKANKELRRKIKNFNRENAELEDRCKSLVVDFRRLKRQSLL